MSDLIFVGQFVASKAGKTGLTVTVDVDRYTISDGSRSSLVTAGSATEGRRGLYHYRLASADLSLYQYVATFITSDATVDQQEIAAIGLVVPDALVTSRLAPTIVGRTLDVSADGEAGLDWANVGGKTSTVALTNTQINSVSGSVGGKVLGGGTDTITGIGAQVASSGGLTAQQTRDAMLLAPTVGMPADGSIDDHLDDLATALAAATATLTVVSAVDGDVLTIYQAVSFQATVSGLSIPAAWTKLWFTVKQDPAQADTDAIIQMIETNPAALTDGLLRLNGAAGTAANGTLTVNQAAGTVVIDLVDENTDDLALATGLHWSLKALATGGATTLLAIGTLNVRGQATAAIA